MKYCSVPYLISYQIFIIMTKTLDLFKQMLIYTGNQLSQDKLHAQLLLRQAKERNILINGLHGRVVKGVGHLGHDEACGR